MKNLILLMMLLIPMVVDAQVEVRQGCVEGDSVNGYGVYLYKDGTRYKGEFQNGEANGNGICYYSNGDYYDGQWANHTFHGFGTLYFNNGTKMEGKWDRGEFLYKTKNTSVTEHKGKVWALLIGVAQYKDYKSLRYTDDDAYRLFSFLKSPEGGAIPDEQIYLLIDEAASSAAIKKHIEEISKMADSNDVILLYLSGHGIRGAFLPSDYNEYNELPYYELLGTIKAGKAKHKIVIADVCYAGSMEHQLLATKGNIDNTINSYYEALRDTKGSMALILSSSADEQSIEQRGIRQGIFSYFLIEGLKGKADKNGDKIITIKEIFEHTKNGVQYYTNHLQNPIIIGEYDEGVPMGVIRE